MTSLFRNCMIILDVYDKKIAVQEIKGTVYDKFLRNRRDQLVSGCCAQTARPQTYIYI